MCSLRLFCQRASLLIWNDQLLRHAKMILFSSPFFPQWFDFQYHLWDLYSAYLEPQFKITPVILYRPWCEDGFPYIKNILSGSPLPYTQKAIGNRSPWNKNLWFEFEVLGQWFFWFCLLFKFIYLFFSLTAKLLLGSF